MEKTSKERAKQLEKNEIAKNLLKMNISIEKIAEATGLSIEEIKSLV